MANAAKIHRPHITIGSPLSYQAPSTRVSSRKEGYRGLRWEGHRKQRGYGGLRGQCYLRDQGVCQHCGRVLGVRPHDWIADHIVPKKAGGPDELSNLQLLCIACHNRKTARERRERKAGGMPV